jgi:hypothetical protein
MLAGRLTAALEREAAGRHPHFAAVEGDDLAAEIQGAVLKPCEAGDRRAARPVERGEKTAFTGDREMRRWIVDRCDERKGARIVAAQFEADGALAKRRQPGGAVENLGALGKRET